MAIKLLLVKDMDSLGRSGDIISVKPGYARNYLIPQGCAVIPTKKYLGLQEKLKEESRKRALIERQESEVLGAHLLGVTLTAVVKVDPEGRMYGSVTPAEMVQLLKEQHQIELEKRAIQLKQAAIKTTGVHTIPVKLKEGVQASFNLKVMSEEDYRLSLEKKSV